MIRTLQRATIVPNVNPPYNTVYLRMYYPAVYTHKPEEQATGQFAVDDSYSPLPVLIFLPETNFESSAYHWLGVRLAERGIMMVTTQWLAETNEGDTTLIAGASALEPILEVLRTETENPHSLLHGHLDQDVMVLGGHASGGSLALLRGDPTIYSKISGVVTYGSLSEYHRHAETLPDIPVLIMEGINSDFTLQETKNSFDSVVPADQGEAYLMLLKEADRMSISQEDKSANTALKEVRNLMVDAICAFIFNRVYKNVHQKDHPDDKNQQTLEAVGLHPMVKEMIRK